MAEMPDTPRPSNNAARHIQSSILLVDAHPASQASLRNLLDELGERIVVAHSGLEAVQRVQQEEFAAVLVALELPGTSGFETARWIRSHPNCQVAPIIFFAAGPIDRDHVEEAYALGAVDLLVPPLLPKVVRAKVRGLVELYKDKQRARREADQFRLLIQGTKDYAIFMLDPQGHIVTWNPGAERLKGYTSEEIIGEHFSRFYPSDALERCWPQYELKVARAEGRFEDEGWRVRKDGSQFWANVVITALRDEQGELLGFSKVTRDLTGRKRTEEALRQSEERFRLLVEGAKDYAIFLLDPEGHIASWNPGAERIKQYRADEIIGQHFSRFYPQEAIDRGWPEHELKVARAEGRFEDEGWRIRKDGSQFWANVVITALRDDAGHLRGFSKITRDMTERKRAEENARRLVEESTARRFAEENARVIQEQRERLRVTLASIGDGVVSIDAEARVDFLNAVAQQLIGCSSDEAVGQRLTEVFQIINEHTRQPVENPALRALEDGRIVGLANHTILLSRQGHEVPIDDSAAPIRDADGNTIGSVLVFRDITARRRAEHRRSARLAANHALTYAEDLEAGASSVLRAVCETLDWDAGGFWMVDETGETLHCISRWSKAAAPAHDRASADFVGTLRRGEGRAGHVWSTGQPQSWPAEGAHSAAAPISAVACPLMAGTQVIGVLEFVAHAARGPDAELLETICTIAGHVGQFIERRRAEEELRQQSFVAETLNRIGSLLSAELDLERLVQIVTDEATRLTGAQFGAFFYNVVGDRGESYTLYTLSGVPHEKFAHFPMPRNTALFGPTFRGEGVVRCADVTQDPRYGQNAPHHGQPAGHLPVRSYLAVPVRSRRGDVLGGLFFGHAEAGVFTAREEHLLLGIAGQAAVAIDNARLYQRTQATAERLNLAMAAAELGDWSWDAESDVVVLSDRAAEMFGTPPGSPITWAELQQRIDPQDRENARREVQRAVDERIQYDIEYRVNRPDGSQAWIAAIGRATYDGSGQALGMFGVVSDITERKRAEEALRESQGLYRAIGESIDYGVWVCDAHGRNVYASDSFLRLVGMTQQECSEFGWGAALHPDDAQQTIADWRECVRRGDAWDREHRFRGVDGRWHHVLARGVPVRNERGEITGWAGINLDIRRLKQVEEELRAGDRRKDEFLATLAHELRNPLAPIRNALQILKMRHVDAAMAQQTRDIMERQVHHLVRLVDDLLDVSRVMRGKIELRKERVELASIIVRAVETATPLIELQGHRLDVSLPHDALVLDADPVRLAQVLGNLLTNAAKYTEPGGRIWLTAQREGDEALVSIRDTGIGIAQDMLPHVFELFVQADPGSTKSQGGLGIGLTLVHNLVALHGGRVEARSAGLGEGSEFIVRIPLSRPAPPENEKSPEEETTQPSGLRLLVVDDNRDAAVSLMMLLNLQGHHVQIAHDGPTALELALRSPPDMMFLDLGMPGMDGYELARRIRASEPLKSVMLVALTGWGQEEDRRRTAAAGFDHHLVKPAEPDILRQILASLIQP